MLLWEIFVLFTRVALFSWGGGPASLALMQRETTAAGWVTAAEFADAVAVGNALPGPIAPQVSAYVGYKMAGTSAAVAAAAGTVFPTTHLMLLMLDIFFGINNRQHCCCICICISCISFSIISHIWIENKNPRLACAHLVGAGRRHDKRYVI